MATTEIHLVETLIIAALKLVRTVHICFDFDFLNLTLGLEAGDISPVLGLIHFPLAVSCIVLAEESGLMGLTQHVVIRIARQDLPLGPLQVAPHG